MQNILDTYIKCLQILILISCRKICWIECKDIMALLTVTDMEGTVSSTIHQNGGIVGNSTISRPSEQLFRIYLYNSPGKTEGDYLLFPAGEYVAEEICVACCKACGKNIFLKKNCTNILSSFVRI